MLAFVALNAHQAAVWLNAFTCPALGIRKHGEHRTLQRQRNAQNRDAPTRNCNIAGPSAALCSGRETLPGDAV